MLINEVSRATNLTKKSIEYYIEQGLICPAVLENGYRDFSDGDIECLCKISVLRKLGISTDDIHGVLSDATNSMLQKLSVQKELDMQRQRAKQSILDKLSCGKSYDSIAGELKLLEQNATITEKLLEAFPGYYGHFMALHFARFLNEPIATAEQQLAYEKIVAFLDGIPPLNLPEELKTYLLEGTNHISTQDVNQIIADTKRSIENPERFLSKNKQVLEEYWAYQKSDEYKNSLAYKLKAVFNDFNNTSGYYDVFLPLMKTLSASYKSYCAQMEIANAKLLEMYPEISNQSI